MTAILITTLLLLSIFCSLVLNKQHIAVLLIVLVSSQMSAQSYTVILVILFTAMLQFADVFFSAKQNKSFLLILLLPITYIILIFLIQPYTINIYYYLGYLAALLIFAKVLLLEWNTETIVNFLTAYGLYLVLAGFIERMFTDHVRVGLAMTVATTYAVVLVITWTIWMINVYLSKIYSTKVILAGTFLVFLAIIFSGTRMGLIGIFMGFGLCGLSVVFIKNKNFNIAKLAVYSIVIIAVLSLISVMVWNLLPDSLFIKKTFSSLIAGKLDSSNMGRVLIWVSAVDIFKHNQFLGIGAGNFPEKCDFFLRSIGIYMKIDANTHAHNIYLIILSEHGIIGFLILGAFTFLCMWQSFLYFLKNKLDPRFYAFFSGFIVMAVLGMVDATPMYSPTTGFAAWLLGACASFKRINNIC
jgi:O-antigen ligase